jgi:hypothetical protein
VAIVGGGWRGLAGVGVGWLGPAFPWGGAARGWGSPTRETGLRRSGCLRARQPLCLVSRYEADPVVSFCPVSGIENFRFKPSIFPRPQNLVQKLVKNLTVQEVSSGQDSF